LFRLQRNFLLYGYPEVWKRENWNDALTQFTTDLKALGITDAPLHEAKPVDESEA
jgi:hypothetical protein